MSHLTEKAYQKIRDAIINGGLKPGERLIEQKICKDFKIGRSPLRESLRLLQMEGYVDLVPNKGVTIRKISIKELEDIYDIISVLEGYALETAIKYLNRTKLNKLKSIQNDLAKAGRARDYRKWIKLNSQFHNYLVKSNGNKDLYKIIRNLRDKIRRYRYMSIINPDAKPKMYIEAHEKILDAISKGNAKQAGEEMRRHVFESKSIVLEFLREFREL